MCPIRPGRSCARCRSSPVPRTGTIGDRDLQARLEAFVIAQYTAGRSLREIAELVDRTQTAVRRVLDKHRVPRRPPGARPLTDQ